MTFAAMFAVVFAAALLQSLSGFGFALILMPVLTLTLSLDVAAPAVALVALTVYIINVARHRRSINLGEVLRLGLASALGVPIGIWVLANVDEGLVKQILGVFLIAYALYAFFRPTTSWVPGRFWVYPTGFLAGCLTGAYNVPGPPVIVYGSMRQWPREEFRAILQAIFLINGSLVVSSHVLARNYSVQILTYCLYALPALLLGILVGSRLDQKVNREVFRLLVQGMILVMGLLLLAGI